MRYSAIITCTTECVVVVDADNEIDARALIERGDVRAASLHDGGLDMAERFHEIEIVNESFGADY